MSKLSRDCITLTIYILQGGKVDQQKSMRTVVLHNFLVPLPRHGLLTAMRVNGIPARAIAETDIASAFCKIALATANRPADLARVAESSELALATASSASLYLS